MLESLLHSDFEIVERAFDENVYGEPDQISDHNVVEEREHDGGQSQVEPLVGVGIQQEEHNGVDQEERVVQLAQHTPHRQLEEEALDDEAESMMAYKHRESSGAQAQRVDIATEEGVDGVLLSCP